jgi:2-methylcitrate dehydratase PrpD
VNDAHGHPRARAGIGATQALAEFCSALTFGELPAEVVAKAKTCILDTLACCLYGSTLDSVRKLATMVLEESGTGGEAAMFGFPQRTAASHAALVNGTIGHAFQLDEVHTGATLHPGSLAVAATFALADAEHGAGGRHLITAIVAAYEVGIRIGLAAKGGMFPRGFHNQGTSGVFVAAAGAARLLGLDANQTRHAFGIAGSQAAGLMAVQEGAMTKGFHSGRAAQSGVYAAKLARLGYTGIPDVLEVEYGGFFSSLVDGYAEEELTADLGKRWDILNVGFKLAPASNGSIAAMSALDKIMREHRLSAEDIEHVTAYVSTNTLHHCGWPYEADKVQGVLAAQMSVRYGIAVMALDREATVDQFAANRILAPETLRYIERVSVEVEPRFDAAGGKLRGACRAAVHTRDGRELGAEVLYRKGSVQDPLTPAELKAKFMSLATKAIPQRVGEEIADIVARLDTVDNTSELTRLLVADR